MGAKAHDARIPPVVDRLLKSHRHTFLSLVRTCPTTGKKHFPTCKEHLRVLEYVGHREARGNCLATIAQLDPPPFDDVEFAHWCTGQARELLRADVSCLRALQQVEHEGASRHTQGSRLLGFLDNLMWGGLDNRTNTGASTGGGSSGQRKRTKAEEKVPVLVCIYHTKGCPPTVKNIEGQRHAHLVTVSIKQEGLLEPLGMNMGSRKICERVEMWEIFGERWMPALPQTHPLTLLEGQGIIFQRNSIHAVPDLDYYVQLTLPTFVSHNQCGVPAWLAYAVSNCAPKTVAAVKVEEPSFRRSTPVHRPSTPQPPPPTPSKRPRRGREHMGVKADNTIVIISSSSDERLLPPKRRPRLERYDSRSSCAPSTSSRAPSTSSRPPSTHPSTRSHSPLELTDDEDNGEHPPPSSQPSSSRPSSVGCPLWGGRASSSNSSIAA
ncbi:hypothetical protein C8T65DRAFT_744887 [Cerioporus squamosus]|nr:hypothetical protein C8T65DRAFT_744887 [Cerioporus squamosus]